MIVADANLVAYLMIPGRQSDGARAVLMADPDWSAPVLWRTEFASILVKYIRRGDFGLDYAIALFQKASELVIEREHAVDTVKALRLAAQSGRSVYDCEYVALAQDLSCRLVTADRKLASSFQGVAVDVEQFLRAHNGR